MVEQRTELEPQDHNQGTLEQPARAKGSSPRRLRMLMDLFIKTTTGEISLTGKDNLAKLPQGAKIIFATSHNADLDVPIVTSVLSKDFDLAITDISKHRNFTADPISNLGLRIAGQDNFLPIDFKKNNHGQWQPTAFNTKNFENMGRAMQNGKAIVIASHNPSMPQQSESAPGYGAIYLAQITDAYIVPVAVRLHKKAGMAGFRGGIKTLLVKPPADVRIGIPFKPERIENAGEIDAIRRKPADERTEKDRQTFRIATEAIRSQAVQLNKTLEQMSS